MITNFDTLPDFLTIDDLINLRVYNSRDAAYFARVNGRSPDHVKIGRKILYPKQSLMEFLTHHLKKSDVSKRSINHQVNA